MIEWMEENVSIVSIEENTETEVFNVSGVKDNHNYFVNGMLVHNSEQEEEIMPQKQSVAVYTFSYRVPFTYSFCKPTESIYCECTST